LIFIDDLDRCRPENVLETLEAVNFLTTSGECFVVIGMAREYVERCVGRAFKDIAEEMIDNLEPERGKPEEQAAEELAKEKRIEFARHYLDKLINIEVPVPAAKQPQSLKLLLAGAYQPSKSEPKTQWAQFKSWTGVTFRRHWRVFPALTALAALLVIGYFLAMSLIGGSTDSSLLAEANPTPSPTTFASPTPMPTITPFSRGAVRNSTPSPTPTPAPPSPSPTAATINERPEIIAEARALVSRSLLPAFALLGMVWFGVTMLNRRPDLVVKDSPNFVDALKIWHPLIFSRQSTPRAIKRFMNRVRYLAMRQRPVSDSERSWLRTLFASKGQLEEPQVPIESPSAENPNEPIPDEALVALAAIEYFNKSIFLDSATADDDTWPPTTIRSPANVSHTYGSDLRKILFPARAEHEKRFGKFDVFKYRYRYLEMAASVEVR
jgi:cell division septation protein DedD